MKFFIVAALCVAAVAGQSLDILKLQKEKALLNKFDRPLMKDVMMTKLGYPWEKTVYGDNVNVDVPLYLQDELLNKQVLTIDELMVHPLFREYINLPLFRQYWTYPAFQKFVTSTYFQRFWQIPTFKQYFYNPVLFYKYILPIVTLFKTEYTTPTTYGNIYGDDMIVNKNVFPLTTGFERDLLKDKYFVPTIYNQDLKLKDEILLKSLLVKIYSHLYEIPEELVKEKFLTGFKTYNDKLTTYPFEKIYNNEKFTTYPFEKIYNKYTTYPTEKIFNEDTIFGDKLYKDELIKKMLLNKMIVGDETTFGDKLYKDELIKKMLLNKMIVGDETTFGDKLYKDELIKKMLLNKMTVGDETVLPEEFLFREKMMKMNPLVTRMMYGYNKLPIYNKFDTIDTVDKMNVFDFTIKKDLIKDEILKKELLKNEILKKELIKDKILYNNIVGDKVNEIEKFGTFETVPKTIVDFATPMMKVRTFEKKIFPETIIKA